MGHLSELLLRLKMLFRRKQLERDLEDEIAFHIAKRTEQLQEGGSSDPKPAAQRKFGNVARLAEECRDVWTFTTLDRLWTDARYATRWLRNNPLFTVTAVLTLALGIGANSTMFTIMSAVYRRGLPVDKPDLILAIRSLTREGGERDVSYPDFQDWQRATQTFTGIAAYRDSTMSLAEDAIAPDRFEGTYVSANAFGLLGEHPVLGREFTAQDDQPGAPAVVILGDTAWKNRYNRDPKVIGRTVRVNGASAVVIGVMRPGFRFPVSSDVWQPLGRFPGLTEQPRDLRMLDIFGRLNENANVVQARTELNAIAARLDTAYPDTNKDLRTTIVPFVERYIGPARFILWALMGAVNFVLLIACANIANLLLSRAANRTHEISVRMSLGATRRRIVHQLLVECILVAGAAGVIGLSLSLLGIAMFGRVIEATGARQYWMNFAMDREAFLFHAAVCFGTAIVFGLAPALHTSRANIGFVLKAGRSGKGAIRVRRWTAVLVTGEIALTLVLLAGAGAMIRNLVEHYKLDHAFKTSGLVVANLALPPERYKNPEQRNEFHRRLEERLAGRPGVSSVTFATSIPSGDGFVGDMFIEGRSQAGNDKPPRVLFVKISRGYFDTMGLTLLRGRAFDRDDGSPGHENAIINQRFAQMYFPGENPIGRRIRLVTREARNQNAPWFTIVGIAPTVRQAWSGPPNPVVFTPFTMDGQPESIVIVRSALDVAAVAPLLREEVRALDPDLPLFDIKTMDDVLSQTRWPQRIFGSMTTIFAIIALVLSTVGLYGVTAYAAAQRTSEIGIRMALGAHGSQILWLVLRRALAQLVCGVILGGGIAVFVFTLLSGTLFEIGPADAAALAVVVVLLLIVALAASLLPALRAARLAPIAALRYE